jgi:hypothetical protein
VAKTEKATKELLKEIFRELLRGLALLRAVCPDLYTNQKAKAAIISIITKTKGLAPLRDDRNLGPLKLKFLTEWSSMA